MSEARSASGEGAIRFCASLATMKVSTGVFDHCGLRFAGGSTFLIGCQAQCDLPAEVSLALIALFGSPVEATLASVGYGAPWLTHRVSVASSAGVRFASFGGIFSSLSFERRRVISMLLERFAVSR